MQHVGECEAVAAVGISRVVNMMLILRLAAHANGCDAERLPQTAIECEFVATKVRKRLCVLFATASKQAKAMVCTVTH